MLWTLSLSDIEFSNIRSSEVEMLIYKIIWSHRVFEWARVYLDIPHSNRVIEIQSKYKELQMNTVKYIVNDFWGVINIFHALGKICAVNCIYGNSFELNCNVINNDYYKNGLGIWSVWYK